MKNPTSLSATATLLALAIPALALAERSAPANGSALNDRQMQVQMGGKPPYKRRFVDSGAGSDPLLVIGDESGTLGRIGPPSRPARSTQPLRAVDPAAGEVAEFARFEEVGSGEQQDTQSGNPARRYRGAPGKHARIRASER